MRARKMINVKNVFIFASIIFLFQIVFGCESGEYYLGKIPIENIDNIYIKLFQEREIDSNLGVTYEIYYKDDSLISRKCFLFGTPDYLDNTNSFKAYSVDNIVFMTYHDSTEVNMIIDLKSMKGNKCHYDNYNNFLFDRDSLFNVLKYQYPHLQASWR